MDPLRGRHLPVWLKHLSTYRTTKGRALKPRSVNKKIEVVRGFIRYLAREGYVQRTLADRLQYVKEPGLLPTSVLTHAQVKSLLDLVDTSQAQGYCDRTMLELLYSSGIRVAELLGLDLDSLDLSNATELLRGGANMYHVKEMLGHESLDTLKHYARLTITDLKKTHRKCHPREREGPSE